MIYLASPYTHPDPHVRQERFFAVEEYTARCILDGQHIFSPIVYAHEMAIKYSIPFTAEYWSEFNLDMILASRGMRVLQLRGWRESLGVANEIKLAKDIALPLEFVHWPE